MKIHLLLKNQKFGPYDLNLVKSFLRKLEFLKVI